VTCGRWPVRRLARLPREGACPLPGAGRRHEHPAIVKHPFWKRGRANPWAAYAAVSFDPVVPREIAERSVLISADPALVLDRLGRAVPAAGRATASGPW